MEWNRNMDAAPRGEKWVLGAVPLDETNHDFGYAYDSVIFDSGIWTDTTGRVVKPVAWCEIEPYRGPKRLRYNWEDGLSNFFNEACEYMPPEFVLLGMAVANCETGEGAIIVDYNEKDMESAVFLADAWQDILGDAEGQYADRLSGLNLAMKSTKTHK